MSATTSAAHTAMVLGMSTTTSIGCMTRPPRSVGTNERILAEELLLGERALDFEAHRAREDLAVHHPVGEERVDRVLEAGGAILLEAEVTDPREAVAGDGHGQQQPRTTGD